MNRLLVLALAVPLGLAAAFQPARAAAPVAPPYVAIKAGPVQLRQDRAYILFRTNRPRVALGNFEQVFLRVPSADEVANFRTNKRSAYDLLLPQLTRWGEGIPLSADEYPFNYEGWPNVFAVRVGDFIDDAGAERIHLIEVAPGDYVVIGEKTAFRSDLQVCHCMGALGFKASAGMITDLGSIISERASVRSSVPELAEVTGVDKTEAMGAYDQAQAVRPATDATPVPPVLSSLPRGPAGYYAVGPVQAAGGYTVDRIAPLTGVLRYEGAKVIDAKTGATLD